MLKLIASLSLISVLISGCVSTSSPKVQPIIGACSTFQIIRPSRQDTLGTKRQVLAHNKVYRATCGG